MNSVVIKDRQIMHGTPCFAGTRVTIQTLFDHLAGGYTVDGFLQQFPSVGKVQVLDLLEQLRSKADELAIFVD